MSSGHDLVGSSSSPAGVSPVRVGAQVGLGVRAGQPGEPGQVRRSGQPQRIRTKGRLAGRQQLLKPRHRTDDPPHRLPTAGYRQCRTLPTEPPLASERRAVWWDAWGAVVGLVRGAGMWVSARRCADVADDGRVKLKLDLHDIYNRGGEIDRALRAVIDEAVAKKAPLVEIIPGKGSGALKKRVLRFLDQREIKALYHRVEKDSDNFGRIFVHFRWK